MQQEDIHTLIELRLLTRNNRLFSAIKENNMTIRDVEKKTNIGHNRLSKVINLRVLPTTEEMMKLSILLSKHIDELFPEALLKAVECGAFHPSKRKKFIDEFQLERLTTSQAQYFITDGSDVENSIDRDILRVNLDKSLSTLSARERELINLRYGLEDGTERSLAQTSREMHRQVRIRDEHGVLNVDTNVGISVERTRQIEAKALRKLRHPFRSNRLKPFYKE